MDETPMTESELAELERLEREATPAPWAAYDNGFDGGIVSGLQPARNGEYTAFDCGVVYDDMIAGGAPYEGWIDPESHNVLLIIASRNAMPRLIAEVRQLRQALGEIERMLWPHVRTQWRNATPELDKAWLTAWNALGKIE